MKQRRYSSVDHLIIKKGCDLGLSEVFSERELDILRAVLFDKGTQVTIRDNLTTIHNKALGIHYSIDKESEKKFKERDLRVVVKRNIEKFTFTNSVTVTFRKNGRKEEIAYIERVHTISGQGRIMKIFCPDNKGRWFIERTQYSEKVPLVRDNMPQLEFVVDPHVASDEFRHIMCLNLHR